MGQGLQSAAEHLVNTKVPLCVSAVNLVNEMRTDVVLLPNNKVKMYASTTA